MARPGWDETWLAVASAIAGRSDCEPRQVGVVIVSPDNRDHWVGYNGPPAGYLESCGIRRPNGCRNYCSQGAGASERGSGLLEGLLCVAVHAEINALMQSDRALRAGGTVYSTAAPCWKCALAVANSGVSRLVCPPYEPERDALADEVIKVMHASRVDFTIL